MRTSWIDMGPSRSGTCARPGDRVERALRHVSIRKIDFSGRHVGEVVDEGVVERALPHENAADVVVGLDHEHAGLFRCGEELEEVRSGTSSMLPDIVLLYVVRRAAATVSRATGWGASFCARPRR